jgi:hypothetical protein
VCAIAKPTKRRNKRMDAGHFSHYGCVPQNPMYIILFPSNGKASFGVIPLGNHQLFLTQN